jgi:hypothetical protein
MEFDISIFRLCGQIAILWMHWATRYLATFHKNRLHMLMYANLIYKVTCCVRACVRPSDDNSAKENAEPASAFSMAEPGNAQTVTYPILYRFSRSLLTQVQFAFWYLLPSSLIYYFYRQISVRPSVEVLKPRSQLSSNIFVLGTYWNLFWKYGDFFFFFWPWKCGHFVTFFFTLYESYLIFCHKVAEKFTPKKKKKEKKNRCLMNPQTHHYGWMLHEMVVKVR